MSQHTVETAYCLALVIGGALISGPAWMSYALKQDKDRAEWLARRREHEARRRQQAGGTHERPRAG